MPIPFFFFDMMLVFLIGKGGLLFPDQQIHIAGAMHRVMQKGELQAVVCSDTLPKSHLYGMGPLENLRGEITIFDGVVYSAVVKADSTIVVKDNQSVCAPFFGWTHVSSWLSIPFPDSIGTMEELETYFLKEDVNGGDPFFFRLSGRIDDALVHVLHLPEGTVVRVPADARKGQLNKRTGGMYADLLGFFSTRHQRVFTHHDSFLHLHLLSNDRSVMGHVDELRFSAGQLKLMVPEH